MAVSVKVTSLFKMQLSSTGINYQDWIMEFSDWKSGSPDSSYLFGRDFPNNNSEYVRHVHVLPSNEDDPFIIKKWNNNFEMGKSAHMRTSDHLLFYAISPKFGYLLISIVSPDGHSTFRNSVLLQKFEAIARDFIIYGKMV
jgi:hypothetical protein